MSFLDIPFALKVVLPLAVLLATATSHAQPRFGPQDVRTVFHIAKSDDRNRVDYGIHLDEQCQPRGANPIYAYWHRFEPGQATYGALNAFDTRVYGIASQRVHTRSERGTWTEMRINALSDLRILVLTQRTAEGCIARARIPVNSRPVFVDRVFVQLSGPFSVEHVEFHGVDASTSAPVSERRRP